MSSKRKDKGSAQWLDSLTGNIRQDFEFGKVLGQGTFSTVRLATDKKTKREVAVKVIDKHNIEVSESALKTEVKILKGVVHKNIVTLYHVYESDKKVYLVMELLTGGELFDRIVNVYPNGYSEKVASELTGRIASSIQFLHSKGIVHRDLKPENLLYSSQDNDCEVKITDFGLAKIAKGALLKTACGTPNYVAPEVLLNEGYTSAVDMWSLGVILYILLCGFPPFYSESTPELFDQIISGRYDFPEDYWGGVSKSAKDLVTKLLQVDPKKRITAKETMNHPWIKGNTASDDVSDTLVDQLKKFNAKRKFKVTVDTIMAASRLMKNLKFFGKVQ